MVLTREFAECSGQPSYLKRLNCLALLHLIQSHSPISRAELSRQTKLSPPTVSKLIRHLGESQLIREVGPGDSLGGRPPTLIDFNSDYGYLAGVDLGGSCIRIGLSDFSGTLVYKASFKVSARERTPAAVLDCIAREIKQVLKSYGIPRKRLKAIGVAAPGITDTMHGVVASAPNLTDWHQVPLKKMVEARLHLPTAIDNDANLAALGEHRRGVAQKASSLVFVAIGTGIGAGILVDGKIYRGHRFAAGEVGYMASDLRRLRQKRGELGWLESIAAGQAIADEAKAAESRGHHFSFRRKHGSRIIDARFVVEAAQQGDPVAIRILRNAATQIGLAVANIAVAFDPEMIVLGGGLSLSGDLLLDPVRKIVHQVSPSQCPVVLSHLGDEAQLHGAILIALELAEREMADMLERTAIVA